MRFEWDPHKNELNRKKHGISIEEPQTIFYDEYAILFDDPDHSEEEDRFLILGFTQRVKLCIVSPCYRGEDEVIRLMSARRATKTESAFYTSHRREV